MRQGKLADRAGAVFQLPQHIAARGIGQRAEHGIEVGVFKLNHLVQYQSGKGSLSSRPSLMGLAAPAPCAQ